MTDPASSQQMRTPTAGRKRDTSMLHSDDALRQAPLDRLMMGEELLLRSRDHSALSQELSTQSHNFAWREKVALWFYDVVDILDESREVVYVAMNMLDRYQLAKPSSALSDNVDYELAAITALFLAVRMSGSVSLDVQDIVQMSRSGIQGKDVILTGTDMIKSLTWEHRLITPSDFVRSFMKLLCSSTSIDSSETVSMTELAFFLVEISVCDQYFVGVPPSKIAYAAMLNVLNNISKTIENKQLSKFLLLVHQLTGMRPDTDELTELASRIRDVYSQTEESGDHKQFHVIEA